MTDNENYKYYERLKRELIAKIGRTMESPIDFVYLANAINSESKEKISETTLKRFFGYITPASDLRTSSLSVMARFLGYSGWKTFCEDASESKFLADKVISTNDLQPGDCVRFEWKPDRICVAEYLGDNRFLVTQAERCKLEVGDQFTATQFLLNNPLMLCELKQVRLPNATPKSYVAGFKTGLTALSLMKR